METNLLKTEGRVCANSNCHHTENQHGDDCCWGAPTSIRTNGPTPGCRCTGFVARRDTTRVSEPAKPLDGDVNSIQMLGATGVLTVPPKDRRLEKALERIATALESIDQKLPWLGQLTATVWPSPPWNPIPQTMCQSPS